MLYTLSVYVLYVDFCLDTFKRKYNIGKLGRKLYRIKGRAMSEQKRLENSEGTTKRYEILFREKQIRWLMRQEGTQADIIRRVLDWFLLNVNQTRDTGTTRERLAKEREHGQNLKPIQIRMKLHHHEELSRLSEITRASKSQWARVAVDLYREAIEAQDKAREAESMDPLEAVKKVKGKAFRPADRPTVRLETDQSIVALLETDTMPEMDEERFAACVRQDGIRERHEKSFQQEVLNRVGPVPERQGEGREDQITLLPHDPEKGTQFVKTLVGVFKGSESRHAVEIRKTLEKMLDV